MLKKNQKLIPKKKKNEKKLLKKLHIIETFCIFAPEFEKDRVSKKFVKYLSNDIYELRTEYESNIYRVFFIFDKGNIVILFNGFQKKSQKTPQNELNKAIKLKEEYYASKP